MYILASVLERYAEEEKSLHLCICVFFTPICTHLYMYICLCVEIHIYTFVTLSTGRAKKQDYSVAVSTPSTSSLIHSPLNGTTNLWRNGWFQSCGRVGARWTWNLLLYQKLSIKKKNDRGISQGHRNFFHWLVLGQFKQWNN